MKKNLKSDNDLKIFIPVECNEAEFLVASYYTHLAGCPKYAGHAEQVQHKFKISSVSL